jgi:uncharacterized repeat protein (TIGR01451 family)
MLIVQPLRLTYAEEVAPLPTPAPEQEETLSTEEIVIIEGTEEWASIPTEEIPPPETGSEEGADEATPSDELPSPVEGETAATASSSDETTEGPTSTTSTESFYRATSTSASLFDEWTCATDTMPSEETATSTDETEEVPLVNTTTEMTINNTGCTTPPYEEMVDWIFTIASSTDATSTDAISTPFVQEVMATSTATSSIATEADETSATTTTISTGNSIATANVLNIANTNLVNSEGAIIFSNLTDGARGAVDLRPIATSGSAETSSCSITSCEGNQGINVTLNNNAHIENLIDVNATSGDNTIENADHAVIESGDAYAALNLVNIANVNFIDSQYLLIALNSFKSVDGDIVFPNLESFFSTKTSSPSVMELNNTATITNDLNINANAGGNETNGAERSIINTGDAHSFANTFNQINTTLGANDTVSILLNIHGIWNGGLENAPPQLWMTQSEDGSYHITTASSTYEESTSGTDGNGGDLEGAFITSTSSALIHNRVHINAVSGMNAVWNADSALITTGNAYAGANLINIANAHVIGRNWLLGIINIFGDFNGNIAFGRPDLWIGARIENSPPFHNGNELNYTFTIMNKGDAPATDIALFDTIDPEHLEILESSLPYTEGSDGQLLWNIEKLLPGTAVELTMNARIKNVAPGTTIVSELLVRGKETDNNNADNRDRISITTYVPPSVGGSSGGVTSPLIQGTTTAATQTVPEQFLPVEVIRTTATTTITNVGTKSTQAITIRNPNAASLSAVFLKDTLHDPSGAVIHNEEWDLGTILPHEEITLGYDISFSAHATSGTYILSSTISRPRTVDTVFQANGMIFLSHEEEAAIPQVLPIVEHAEAVEHPLPHHKVEGAIVAARTETNVPTETMIENSAIKVAHAQSEENPIDRSIDHRNTLTSMIVVALALLFMIICDKLSTRGRNAKRIK